MTLLKDSNYKNINIALLSLENDIKKLSNFDTSSIDKQLAEINERIDEINTGSGSSDDNSAEINDLRTEIENIDANVEDNSAKIADINTKLSKIFSAENFVEDFNTATEPGIYYWTTNSLNSPATYGVLLVYEANGNWRYQTAYATDAKIYYRVKISGADWTSWRTIAYEDITKTYTIPDVTTPTARYIKLGTFPWYFSETVRVELSGANLEDTVEFNVLGGNGKNASVNGWHTTNSGQTKDIRIVPVAPVTFASSFEVWLGVVQSTTLTVKLTGSANAAQYFNTNPQMNNTQTAPTGSKEAAVFNMQRGFFGYNENTLNCYNTTMVGLGFTKDQVVSVSQFAQALINYTGTHRGQVHFEWSNAHRAYIKATAPYNAQLEISGGTLTFSSRNKNANGAWTTFGAEYVNRNGELFTFGINTDDNNVNEYVRKSVDTSGKVATAGTADTADNATTARYADRLKAFASWESPYDYDATNGIRVFVYKITMPSYFNSILVQIWDDINYARCRRYILGLWHVNNYGYSVSVTDLGGTKDGGLKVWLGNDGNVYLQADVYWNSRISFSHLDDVTNVTITKIGAAKYGSNADINGNVLFTPLTDPITDCGALRAEQNLYSASKVSQILKTDVLTLQSPADVTLDSFGKEPLSIGIPGGKNLGIDVNELQARNNGAAAPLYINGNGGKVVINDTNNSNGGLQVGGKLNIPTSAPSNPEKGDIWLVL